MLGFVFPHPVGDMASDGARVCPLSWFRLAKVPVICSTVAEGANGLREPTHAQPEHTIRQAVDDTVAKAVANGQPSCYEGEGRAVQHVGAF